MKASLIVLPLFALSISFSLSGKEVYDRHCSTCHGKDRLGLTAPPLIPEYLERYSEGKLERVIKNGIPATQMPAFPNLSEEELRALIAYIRKPVENVRWNLKEIQKTYKKFNTEGKNFKIKDLKNLIVAVDKGGEVYLLEGMRVLDRVPFKNVHGGVKFDLKNLKFYVPSRDGWILAYDVKKGKPLAKIRACVYLRNITLAPAKGELLAACVLPRSLVVLDSELKPKKVIILKGRPSAVYSLGESSAVLGFRDIPFLATYRDGKVSYHKIEFPTEDFFIDPFGVYVVGSSRKNGKLVAYRLSDFKKVFSAELSGMPHLFSVAFWYRKGNFYFATRHINGKTSIWRMYDWKLVEELNTGRGFFVRTSHKSPFLWLDTQSQDFLLLNKKSLELERKRVVKEGITTHVEFSGDGKLAYFSVLGKNSGLLIADAFTLERKAFIPMKHPAGKYSILYKTRSLYPALLGYEVFMEKCWGCHHTSREAFAPPFKWIAQNRPRSLIIAQILNPEKTYKLLGYEENAMPKIKLSSYELEAILSFMEALKDGWID